jgi:uncharacterized small protein (DUF1192 family)
MKMSFDDDLEPQHPAVKKEFEQVNVEALSVEELKAYIEHAKEEILRTEAEIKSREALRGDADSLFKK